jgi:ABC-2 type transport system permease protein
MNPSALVKVLEIARTNLVRTFRDRGGLFFVFVLPIVIVVALGIQFGGAGLARIGVVAPAGDALAAAFLDDLGASSARLEVREVPDEATLRSSVERGLLEVGVVIPDGYGRALEEGATARVEFLGTPSSLTLGLRPSVEAALARQSALLIAARTAETVGAGTLAEALPVAEAGLDDVPGVEVRVERVGGRGLFAGFGQFTLGAQSQLTLFMFLTSLTAATQLVLSKRLGVSRRMLSTPSAVGTILAGEALGRFAVTMMQGLFIVLVTAVAFGVDWGDPLAAGAIVVAFGTVGAGIAMLVGAVSTNPEQAGSVAVFAGLGIGALGGAMVPIEFMPEAMRTLARLTPHAWAIEGLRTLVSDGGGLDSVLVQVLVLLGFGVATLALATWRFRRALTG